MYTDSPMRSLDDKGNYKYKLSLVKIATEREKDVVGEVGVYEEGFSGRKIGGGGFIKTVEEEKRRETGLERERDGRPVRGRGVRLGLEGSGGDFTSVKG